jgi:prolyl-tRNA synthetase
MRASRLHIVTYREDPADAEVVSHRLMARSGLIFKLGSGLYTYSPMLWRSIKKASNIIRRELDEAGCLELQLPIMQEQSLWEQSGRWEAYQTAGVMLSTTDRKGTTFGLAPTAEEVVTAYMRATCKSYKQLPVTLYQIHT